DERNNRGEQNKIGQRCTFGGPQGAAVYPAIAGPWAICKSPFLDVARRIESHEQQRAHANTREKRRCCWQEDRQRNGREAECETGLSDKASNARVPRRYRDFSLCPIQFSLPGGD